MDDLLNIADICNGTYALGPGFRAAIWVQGCPIGCKGCISQDWIPFKIAHLLKPEEAGDLLIKNPDIEGLTISGGEPMMQAEGLAAMLRYIKNKRNLHIISFTGFRYETLMKWESKTKVFELLQEIDVLIDGPYIENQNNGQTFAGSTNQRILNLSEKPLPRNQNWQNRKIEFHLRERNILAVGIPPKNWVKNPQLSISTNLSQRVGEE